MNSKKQGLQGVSLFYFLFPFAFLSPAVLSNLRNVFNVKTSNTRLICGKMNVFPSSSYIYFKVHKIVFFLLLLITELLVICQG